MPLLPATDAPEFPQPAPVPTALPLTLGALPAVAPSWRWLCAKRWW